VRSVSKDGRQVQGCAADPGTCDRHQDEVVMSKTIAYSVSVSVVIARPDLAIHAVEVRQRKALEPDAQRHGCHGRAMA
jgi:hypothetical protein